MTRTRNQTTEPFDPEIERTLHQLTRQRRAMAEDQRVALPALEQANRAINQRSLIDYVTPTVKGTISSIRRPSIQANNFEIKPSIIQMIQTSI